jgi:hypothetical protein
VRLHSDMDEAHAMINEYVNISSGTRVCTWRNAPFAEAFAELDSRIHATTSSLCALFRTPTSGPLAWPVEQKEASSATGEYQDEDETNERFCAMHRQKKLHGGEANVTRVAGGPLPAALTHLHRLPRRTYSVYAWDSRVPRSTCRGPMPRRSWRLR